MIRIHINDVSTEHTYLFECFMDGKASYTVNGNWATYDFIDPQDEVAFRLRHGAIFSTNFYVENKA